MTYNKTLWVNNNAPPISAEQLNKIEQGIYDAHEAVDAHAGRADNPHGVSAAQVGALVSVDGVSNPGGDVDLVADGAITLIPDDTNKRITIGETHSTQTDNPHNVTAAQVGALVSVDGVSNAGGNVDLVPSDTVTLTPDDTAKQIRIGTKKLPIFVEGGHLFHFDGDLGSTRGLQPLSGYVATLRPGEGRFGGAVAVEEGTTNLFPSNIAHGTGGINAYGEGQVYADNAERYWEGGSSCKIVAPNDWDGFIAWSGQALASGVTVTASCYAWIPAGKAIHFSFRAVRQSDGTTMEGLSPKFVAGTSGWQRVVITWTTAEAITNIGLQGHTYTDTSGATFWIDGLQLEQKPFATSFVDGTRAAGGLSYPVRLGRKGTIAFWWNKEKRLPSGYEMPFRLANNVFEANIRDTEAYVSGGNIINAPVSWNPGEWHHWAYAWDIDADDTKQWLAIDGQVRATSSAAPSDPMPYSTLYVGWGGGGYWFNGLLDELLILPYAASAEEIRSWYEAQAPFYDPETWYHPGNDGAGSELDADKLDGYHASTGAAAGTIPVRDSSGRLPGDITGNAATVGGRAPGVAGGLATLNGSGLVEQDSAYASGVSGFTPSTVRAALDALAGVRIVEMGTNANGGYVRWENGLQVCYRSDSRTIDINIADNGAYRSPGVTLAWPASFVNTLYVIAGVAVSGSLFVRANVTTSSYFNLAYFSMVSSTGAAVKSYYIAIGAWK